MRTFKGNSIPQGVLGVVYLCDYNYANNTIEVFKELLFEKPGDALHAYSEIPNPPSQVAMGNTREEFKKELERLHANLNNPEWVKELAEYL